MYRIGRRIFKYEEFSFNLKVIISYKFLTIYLIHLLFCTYVFFPVLVVGNEI